MFNLFKKKDLRKYDSTFWGKCSYEEALNALNEGVDINGKLGLGYTPLLCASEKNVSVSVIKLLLNNGANIEEKDILDHSTPLVHAICSNPNKEIVKTLLEYGASLEEKSGESRLTAFQWAAATGISKSSLELLLEYGAEIDTPDSRGSTPLMMACYQNPKEEIALFLIKNGANIKIKDKEGRDALHYASSSEYGRSRIIKELIEHGIAPSHLTLRSLCEEGNLELLKEIIPQNTKHIDNDLLQHIAEKTGNPEIIELIVNNFSGCPDLSTALCCATQKNSSVEVVEKLIQLGADINCEDERYKGMLTVTERPVYLAAAYNKNPEIIETLIKHGVDIEIKNEHDDTPLLVALNYRNSSSARKLIELGANINAQGYEGDSVLYTAYQSCPDVVDLLLSKKANIKIENDAGDTTLCLALRSGDLDGIKKITQYGATIGKINKNNHITKLMQAVTSANKDVIDYLISDGEDINSEDKEGRTALFYAICNPDCFKYLIELGADINHIDKMGNTPLIYACITYLETCDISNKPPEKNTILEYLRIPLNESAQNKIEESITALIENGAVKLIKNKKRKSAKDYAQRCGIWWYNHL